MEQKHKFPALEAYLTQCKEERRNIPLTKEVIKAMDLEAPFKKFIPTGLYPTRRMRRVHLQKDRDYSNKKGLQMIIVKGENNKQVKLKKLFQDLPGKRIVHTTF